MVPTARQKAKVSPDPDKICTPQIRTCWEISEFFVARCGMKAFPSEGGAQGVLLRLPRVFSGFQVFQDPGVAAGRIAIGLGTVFTLGAGVGSWRMMHSLMKLKLL